jgi:hypothetical protein
MLHPEKKEVDNQKRYVADWIVAAQFMETQRTRTAIAAFTSPGSKGKDKRSRMSSKKPQLPSYQFNVAREHHVAIVTDLQRRCAYCKYLLAVAKLNGTDPLPTVARPARKCLICGDHLCSVHFDLFHTPS